jgi:hypothetical protein
MKNISKENDNIATKKGERLIINVLWIRTAILADNRYWMLIMDKNSIFLWSYFMKTKDETKHHAVSLILDSQKHKNIKVKFIFCNNSGEIREIQQEIIQIPKIRVQFEFTAPKKMVKLSASFATLYGETWATLNDSEFTWPLRHGMRAYCALIITNRQ